MSETTPRQRKQKPSLRILNMMHDDVWQEKRELPTFLYPAEYSIDPCGRCSGHCCQTEVYITAVEAMRLALTLSLPLEAVVVCDPADSPRGRNQSLPIPLDEGEVRLRLRHTEQTQACVFFHSVVGRGMCAVHGIRPGVCRIFPYQASYLGERVSAGAPIVCPVSWTYNQDTERRLQADLDEWYQAQADEKKLITAWRRHKSDDRSFAAFYHFAVRKLAKRYGKNADEILRPPRRRLGERRAKPA